MPNLFCFFTAACFLLPPSFSQTRIAPDSHQAGTPDARGDLEEVVLEPASSRSARNTRTISVADLDSERLAEQYRVRAIECLNGEDYESADRLLRRGLDLAPFSYSVRFTLGILRIIHGDRAEGEALVEQALALEPPCAVLRSYSDSPCWLEKYHSRSHQMLGKALALGISQNAAYYFTSLVAFREGDWRQAARQLGNIRSNRFPLKDFYLMLAFERLNRGKEAAASYGNFVRRRPVSLQEARLPAILAADASSAPPGAAGGSRNALLNR